MSIPIRSNLDLGTNQLLSACLEVLSSAPGSGPQGRIYYNSTSGKIAWHNGSAFVSPYVDTTRLDQITAPTADVSLNSQKITNLATPTASGDAATKGYVDSAVEGLNVKDSVRVATTAAGTLATSFENGDTVDGVTLATGDRILIKNQAAGAENGIYTVNATGAPTRAADADSAADLRGAAVFVEQGTTNADTLWTLTTDSITLGTTALVFAQFGGATTYVGGSGLTLSGNTFDVNVDASSIEINADTLRVKALGITNAMLAGSIDLSTKMTGLLPLANGGLNVDLSGTAGKATARDNLADTGYALVRKKSFDITGDGTTTAFAVTHSLNNKDIQVQVWEATTDLWVIVDITRTDNNVTTITFATAPAVSKVYRVVVMG